MMKVARMACKNNCNTVSVTDESGPSIKRRVITPAKVKNKASKSENSKDVHAASSPVTPKSKSPYRANAISPVASLANAYYIGACTQDLPEVIWDFNSPKNKKSLKPDRPMTVHDLLNNLQNTDEESSENQSNPQLLEKWMKLNNISPAVQKVLPKNFRRNLKKPSRALLEEMQQFLESMAKQSCVEENNNPLQSTDGISNENYLKIDDLSFSLWGDDTDADDELLVNATQEFEQCLIDTNPVNSDVSSKQNSLDSSSSSKSFESPVVSDKNSYELNQVPNKGIENTTISCSTSKDSSVEIGRENCDIDLLLETTDCDWDSVFDDNEWADNLIDDSVAKKADVPKNEKSEINDLQIEKKSFSSFPVPSTADLVANAKSKKFTKIENCVNLGKIFSSATPHSSRAPKTDSNKCLNKNGQFASSLCSNFGPKVHPVVEKGSNNTPILPNVKHKTDPHKENSKCTPAEIARKKREALRKLREKQKICKKC